MPTIRLVQIVFDFPATLWDISAFRGAIAEKVGFKHILFHNHLNDGTGRLRFRYPLIQYKVIDGNAAILCIEKAVDEVYKLFSDEKWYIQFRGKQHALQIKELQTYESEIKTLNTPNEYLLYNWLALNQKNFPTYHKLQTDKEKYTFLERILTGHIISFARGIDWFIEERVNVEITTQPKSKQILYKKLSLASFKLRFKTNVSLPNYISIGKGASKGYGIVKKISHKT